MIVRAMLAFLFPVVVFLGGARLMLIVAGAARARAAARYGKPLNQRFGYTRDAVVELWGRLSSDDLAVERRLLQVDLLFPFAYGGALAVSLLTLWATLGRRFNPAWILLPVVLGVVADWTENLVQLQQLQRFTRHGPASVEGSRVAVASAATMVKLASLLVAAAVLVVLTLLSLGAATG
jgi:hypothetical protein